jgi:hypothetical protein
MIQVAPAFEGHGACAAAPWIQQLVFLENFNEPIASRSFHPNVAGQRAYAKELDRYLTDWVAQQKPLSASGVPQNPAPSVPASCVPQTQLFGPATATPSFGSLFVTPVGSPPCDGRGNYVPGQQFRVTGGQFGANASLTLRLQSNLFASDFATATADAGGKLDVVVTLPAAAPVSAQAEVSARGVGALGEPRLAVTTIGVSTSFAADADGDGVPDPCDLCPGVTSAGTADADGDGIGDACDPCPNDTDNDADADGLCSTADLCPWDSANDADADGDCEADDNCPFLANADQFDSDRDGVGNACDGAPSDPGLKAVPAEVSDLAFEADGQTMTWTSATATAGALTVHDVTGARSMPSP